MIKRGKNKQVLGGKKGQHGSTVVAAPSSPLGTGKSENSVPPGPRPRSIPTQEAADLVGVGYRAVTDWIARGDVTSPKPGQVYLESLFDFVRLRAGVQDETAKEVYTEKLRAEIRRIEVDSDYKAAMIGDVLHRRLADLTSDDRKAGALHAKLLLAGAEYLRDLIAQFLLDSVRRASDPYNVVEALAEISIAEAALIVNVFTEYVFGKTGMDYSSGELYASVTGQQGSGSFDLTLPHWVGPSTVKGTTVAGYWSRWIPFTQEEIAEQLKENHSAKGGRFVTIDAPPPTSAADLAAKLAAEVERKGKRV